MGVKLQDIITNLIGRDCTIYDWRSYNKARNSFYPNVTDVGELGVFAIVCLLSVI